MKSLNIQGTSKTPTIIINTAKETLEIEGRSIPENALELYAPLVNFLDEYLSSSSEFIKEVNVKLEYFNTSSSKCIFDIFKKLETIYKRGQHLTINWYYEEDDEDILEAGEDYQSIIKIPFNFKQI